MPCLESKPKPAPESISRRRRPKCQASERSVPSGLQTLSVKLVGLQIPFPIPSMCGIFTYT